MSAARGSRSQATYSPMSSSRTSQTSGGCWRTLAGIADFADVQSYLSTATKWGLDTSDVLNQLFTAGAWLPPAPRTLLNSYGPLSCRFAWQT